MKALIYTRYTPPGALEFKEVDRPIPKEDEVLVKVQAVGINAADWHLLTADIILIRLMGQGFFKPKQAILGSDMAGRVVGQPKQLFLKDLLKAGKISPVIDRCYPFSQAPEALRYLGEGHARGKVVITMES